MKRVAATVMVFLAVGASAARAGLEGDIQKVLDDKYMRGKDYGVEVLRLGSSPGEARVIYAKNAGVPRMPASNLKLITTSAALSRLGPDFKFRTKFMLRGNDVILVGDGDPTLGDSDLLAGTGWGTTTVFEHWAAELKKRGVNSVGNVVVDDSVFDQVFLHPHWSQNQYMQPHSAEVAGVSLNANLINVTVKGTGGKTAAYALDPASRVIDVKDTCDVGNQNRVILTREKDDMTLLLRGEIRSGASGTYRCTVHDPALFAAGALADVLEAKGIHVTGKVLRDRAGAEREGGVVVGINETPLPVVVTHANKESQNLYAESLCKRLGHAATGQPGSWANGTAVVGEYLRKVGVGADEFKLDDGCGLSRGNAISPHAMCQVLASNYYGETKAVFMNSLAVGGVDGTLEHRFTERDLKGKVFAKTGFIEGVSSLSGYLQGRDGNFYAFSILINGIPPKSNSIYKEYQERIVRAVNDNLR
jgi:D-alanyl-D-alanine carboxypeptidase/D-alanyl-D-alanine-endopeptidase (penicillin-binding protein 4)